MTNPVTERRPRAALASLALALLALHAPLAAWLLQVWNEEHPGDVALSLVTPLVVAGLLYLRRADVLRLLRAPAQPLAIHLPLALLAALAAAAALALDATPATALTLPLAAYALAAAWGGHPRAAPLLPPLAMLAFLLPTTHPRLASASHDLQIASAEAATRILRALRFPSARYGTTIVTEDALNNVSEACSGMNTLTALLLFTLVLAFLLRLQAWQTLASVAFMLPLALATNGARIAFISWLHWRHGYDIAMGDLHNLSAYALFALAYATLFAFMRHLTFATNAAQPRSAPPSQHHRPDHA